MMPNVTRGEDMPELVRYLFGPGRHNEHTNQRMIACSAGVVALGAPRFQEPGELKDLAGELDAPWVLFDAAVPDGHVWHCSLSVPPEDGELTDEAWEMVARRVVDDMGFSDAGGKAPCRWIAVHHGKSIKGNDHIHLAVNLVREDGTTASVWRDRPRVQNICGALEKEMGLRVVEGRGGRSTPGIKRGEAEAAKRRGEPEPARLTLARRVRAAAATAEDEADFVRTLRASGVIARPRYAKGGQNEVTGYSVALHSKGGETPVWFSGGKLARDLTLTRLRQQWPDNNLPAAVDAWKERGRRAADRSTPWLRDETAWEMAAQQITDVRARLAEVPPTDVVRWSQAAHEAAGVLAVWSARIEGERPGPLARASDVLARSAQRAHEYSREPLPERPGQLKGAALVARYTRSGGVSYWGEGLFLQAMRNTMRAIHQMHQAREERDQARQIEKSAREELAALQQRREALKYGPGGLAPTTLERAAEHRPIEDPGRDDEGHGR